MSEPGSALRRRFESAGQGHVFAFWPELDARARERLTQQLVAVDLDLVRTLGELARAPRATSTPARFEAPEVFPLLRNASKMETARRAQAAGADLLRAGRVGYLLVAGGQASRLGYDGPKGAFPVGPVSGRSLFELFARKLIAARERHAAPPNWYVMTSHANDASTRTYFAEHHWFGLPRDCVFFFEQAMLPALDSDGRILLAGRNELFLAPNGHGGVLAALAASGGLAHARERGVETFSYFQVDNPLAPPADPLFLGLHALAGAQMSSKVVTKRDAHEKVGVIGQVEGRLACIEYSDLPGELREARDVRGALVFGAGNIALHVIELAFVERLTRGELQLPWHVAEKQIHAVDPHGVLAPRLGFKFETFVFDALAFAQQSVVLEVDRAQEFSPVKNQSGADSPATARADQCRLFAAWVQRAGLTLPPADLPGSPGTYPVEVDPVYAENAEEFLAHTTHAPRMSAAGHFYT